MAYQIQARCDSAANWTSVNPTLGQGELGVEVATYPTLPKFKIGDGTHAWVDLSYFAASGGGGSGGVFAGSGTPDDADGDDGNLYFDAASGGVIWFKDSGSWVNTGASILDMRWTFGSGAPSAPAFPNDMYLNTSSGELYKSNGSTWGSPVYTFNTGGGGASVFSGSGVPDDADGSDGNLYFDIGNNAEIYFKDSGTWQDVHATLGGEHFLVGSGAPSGGAPVDGDMYLDTASGDLYKRVSGSWGSPVYTFNTGGGGGLSFTAGAAGVTEIQNIALSGMPDHGTFKLNHGSDATGDIDLSGGMGAIQTALQGLPGFSSVTVGAGSGMGANVDVTFTGVDGDVSLLTVSDNSLEESDNTPITFTVTESTAGVAAANDYLLIGEDDGTSAPTSVDIRGAKGTGSDIAGASINVFPGNGTGAGGSGNLNFHYAPPNVGGAATDPCVMAPAFTVSSTGVGFFGATPVLQQTMGSATAGGTWTSTEQDMLQAVYDAVRAFGLGT